MKDILMILTKIGRISVGLIKDIELITQDMT